MITKVQPLCARMPLPRNAIKANVPSKQIKKGGAEFKALLDVLKR